MGERIAKLKVYNAEPYGYELKAIQEWETRGYQYYQGSWDEIDNASKIEDVHILIVRLARKIDSNILNKFNKLKCIVSATTGTDHIDLIELEKRNILLHCLKPYKDFLNTIPSTAEHTWAILLSLLRNVPLSNESVKVGNWNRDAYRGTQLKGKKLGIIGLGRVGNQVAKYAKAFEMDVKFYDPYIKLSEFEKIDDLETLFSLCDIFSFHIHLNTETIHLLNKKNIRSLKKGAFLINTSRGQIWDEAAIADAVKSKIVSGVSVDVLNNEFHNIKKSPLWILQNQGMNVIITPHIGGATWEAMRDCEFFLAKNFNTEWGQKG